MITACSPIGQRLEWTDPLVGTAVAHYEVIAKLGGGGMGVVYTARDVRLGATCRAQSSCRRSGVTTRARSSVFLREAQAASATPPSQLCTIHDIDTAADGQLFIVMAYYEGQDPEAEARGRPPAVEEAVEIARAGRGRPRQAHAEGVVHRDIKPGNLIVVEDDEKILDSSAWRSSTTRFSSRSRLDAGTIAYMSPEQTRGEEADARSDIWAVGVVLHEMLTGWLPFRGAYPEAISHANPATIRCPRCVVPGGRFSRADSDQSSVRSQKALRSVFRAHASWHAISGCCKGRTIPLDLLTAPINAPALRITASRRWWRSRAALATAALLAIGGVGLTLWVFAPVARVPVVVAPVVNQTGYAELDPISIRLDRRTDRGAVRFSNCASRSV
jgi:serine/threonine protein kinase